MSDEGGALLLCQAERKIRLLQHLARCVTDARDPVRIVHEGSELLTQRIYAVLWGYEDLNDHEESRRDPLLAVLAGKREPEEPLAGKSTLNRLELTRMGKRKNSSACSAAGRAPRRCALTNFVSTSLRWLMC